MSSTTVMMTFANRQHDPGAIELIHAWDMDDWAGNPTGYEDTKREAIAAIGGDILRWVTVEVQVPDDAIRTALMGELPVVRAGDIVSVSDRSVEP